MRKDAHSLKYVLFTSAIDVSTSSSTAETKGTNLHLLPRLWVFRAPLKIFPATCECVSLILIALHLADLAYERHM